MCIVCNNPEKDGFRMYWWRVRSLCPEHLSQWKIYKQKIGFVTSELDRLLDALEFELKLRKQIGKR